MGFMDKIKGMFGGGGVKAKVDKVVAASKEQVLTRAVAVSQGRTEHEAKRAIADIASEIVNDQINNILGGGLPAPIRSRVVEMAVERIVDEVWDQVKGMVAAA